jgi:membrane associated rhomboid family serine protease
MGIYDRDYYRKDEANGLFSGRSMVVNLIIVTSVIFVADMLADHKLMPWLELPSNTLRRPWDYWRLLTYGFAHDPQNIMHIVFNMLGLFIFGREIEDRYGRWEFLRFYLVTVVFGGFVWLLTQTGLSVQNGPPLVGASGAVVGIVVLNILNNPRRELLLFGVVPMQAWVFGSLFILWDVFGAMNRSTRVAHSVHLAGAAFAGAYFYFGWNFGAILPANLLKKLKAPRLRVHRPEEEDTRDLSARVDEILDKIHRQGEGSLTSKERRTLEEASKRYQRRHNS